MKLLSFSLFSLGLMARSSSAEAPPAQAATGGAGTTAAAQAGSGQTTWSGRDPATLVRCKVLINSLGEGDETYAKGETFETTAERAEALGNSVEIIN